MGRPRIEHRCRDCGEPCAPRGRYKNGYSCAVCGVGRHVRAATEINARQGEYYEKWVVGMAAAVERARAVIEAHKKSGESAPVE